jgi:hypothetical protein
MAGFTMQGLEPVSETGIIFTHFSFPDKNIDNCLFYLNPAETTNKKATIKKRANRSGLIHGGAKPPERVFLRYW